MRVPFLILEYGTLKNMKKIFNHEKKLKFKLNILLLTNTNL